MGNGSVNWKRARWGILIVSGLAVWITGYFLELTPNDLLPAGVGVPMTCSEQWTPKSAGDDTGASGDGKAFAVEAHWEKMLGGKMALWEHDTYGQYLQNLAPVADTRGYGRSELRALLPDSFPGLGEVWRHDAKTACGLLMQLHEGGLVDMRIGPRGMVGSVRAISETHYDILYRLHAEFHMGPDVYLTPAAFDGRIIVNRKTSEVEYLRFALPTGRPLNTDLNAGRLVDIAFTPRMELVGGDASSISAMTWSEVLPETEVRKRLARAFYDFLSIRWQSLAEATRLSRERGSPILAMVMWGPLDDQSC